MADKSTVYVTDLNEIPFNNMIVGKAYVLANPSPTQTEMAKALLRASPQAKGRRPMVMLAFPGQMKRDIRIIIMSKPAKGESNPFMTKGRQPGMLAQALVKLNIDDYVIAELDGRTVQSIRNIVRQIGARNYFRFSVQSLKPTDKRIEAYGMEPQEGLLLIRRVE